MLKPKIIRKLEAKIAWIIQKPSRLKNNLIRLNRTKWLDIGSSLFNEGFYCLNIHSPSLVKDELRERYFQYDVVTLNQEQLQNLGKFDLIRMQHVFEHFSLEDGQNVLKNCLELLVPDGYLIITVPDLRIHIQSYLDGYMWMKPYVEFTRNRIPDHKAPSSFIFSMYAHQGGYSPIPSHGDEHKWCYDYEGLRYQVEKVGGFKNIRRLGLLHSDANIPFTHNRPHEDVCLLAQKT